MKTYIAKKELLQQRFGQDFDLLWHLLWDHTNITVRRIGKSEYVVAESEEELQFSDEIYWPYYEERPHLLRGRDRHYVEAMLLEFAQQMIPQFEVA